MVSLYTDWLWFKGIGQLPVFLKILGSEIKLGLLLGMTAFLLLYANLTLAHRYRSAGKWHKTEQWLDLALRTQLDPHILRLIPTLCMVFGFIVGLSASTQWETYLLYKNPSSFGITETIFGSDYGFYVFQYPFLKYIQGWGTGILVLMTLLTTVLYAYHGGVGFTQGRFFIDSTPKRHLLALVGVILTLKAAGYRLSAFELLFTIRGIVTGAVYADVQARIPVFNLLAFLALGAGVAVIASGFLGGWRIPIGAIGLLFVVSILGGAVYPDLLHKFRVQPNEIVLERPAIENNISATRYAFGLNNIEERDFPVDENLSVDDLINNDLTIKNIRLWDHQPLLSTYRQLQQIRTYYDFVDVDNDRYMINGEYRQVMLSPRELSYQNLPGGANWINEHLTYTHGYGVTLGPVNRITPEGLPEFMIKDIPPQSTVDIKVTRPELYYSELANDYVFVKTKALEFDYPLGDENKYTEYDGKGGVEIGTLIRKLIFSIRFGSIKILLSNDIGPESRILYYRNVMERIERLAPFLLYDRDPYLVIRDDGRMVWIIDGYTVSSRIPNSHQLRGIGNYIRNSVKGVIDAYDGTVTLYISDPSDPVIQTYSKMFPGLLQSADQMPSDIRVHLRYPQDLFRIQSHLYSTYHMQDPQIFYNKEDLWDTPQKDDGNMEPYYTIMKLPQEEKEEFILLIPYTPARRDNMSAWLAARSDGENYGKLVVFLFPKQKLIYGPRQIEARIDQDGHISQQITLWGQRGSQVIRGSLLVIPIENSLLYIEPLYLAAESGSLPELRRVIVAYGNKLSMQKNLEGALSDIFGEGSIAATALPGAAAQDKGLVIGVLKGDDARQALRHYQKAQSLLKAGDWAGYGKELKSLEGILKRLAKEKE